MFPEEGYGFIQKNDSSKVYFHRNSIHNSDFENLAVGDEVRFCKEVADEGFQASTVRVINKQQVVGNY